MMSRNSHIAPIFFATLVMLFFSQCKKENMGDCLKSTGTVVTESRDLANFNRIEVFDNINVFIHFGEAPQAEIEAGSNLLKLIETSIEGETLYIRNNNKCNWVRSFEVPINVHLTCTSLSEIVARGVGDIETVDTIEAFEFLAEQWESSGTMKLKLNTKGVYLKSNTGPADFHCSGTTDYLYAYSSSYGIFRLEELTAEGAYIWNKGTGDIYVNTSNSLEVILEYIGDVYYTGDPEMLNVTATHSGQAIPF